MNQKHPKLKMNKMFNLKVKPILMQKMSRRMMIKIKPRKMKKLRRTKKRKNKIYRKLKKFTREMKSILKHH